MIKRRQKLLVWTITLFWIPSLFTIGCAQKSVVKEQRAGGEVAVQKEAAAGAGEASEKRPQRKERWQQKKVGKKKAKVEPVLWPVIYEANKDKIKNPNRIYFLGQKLVILCRDMTIDDIKDARKKAGAPKPYTPSSGACAPLS